MVPWLSINYELKIVYNNRLLFVCENGKGNVHCLLIWFRWSFGNASHLSSLSVFWRWPSSQTGTHHMTRFDVTMRRPLSGRWRSSAVGHVIFSLEQKLLQLLADNCIDRPLLVRCWFSTWHRFTNLQPFPPGLITHTLWSRVRVPYWSPPFCLIVQKLQVFLT